MSRKEIKYVDTHLFVDIDVTAITFAITLSHPITMSTKPSHLCPPLSRHPLVVSVPCTKYFFLCVYSDFIHIFCLLSNIKQALFTACIIGLYSHVLQFIQGDHGKQCYCLFYFIYFTQGTQRAGGGTKVDKGLVDIVMGCERVMAKVMAVTSMSTNKCVSTYFISFLGKDYKSLFWT